MVLSRRCSCKRTSILIECIYLVNFGFLSEVGLFNLFALKLTRQLILYCQIKTICFSNNLSTIKIIAIFVEVVVFLLRKHHGIYIS